MPSWVRNHNLKKCCLAVCYKASLGMAVEQIASTPYGLSYRTNRRFQFKKRRQLFIGAHSERLPSPRCASTIQIVRRSTFRTETQSKLQPAYLRLSAIRS